MESTSVSLIQRLRDPNDADAWQRFVSLYVPALHAWTKKYHIESALAEDLIQEVLILLLEKLPHFEYDQSKSFRAWLKVVTMNKWRELQRKGQPMIEFQENELAQEEEPFWEQEFRQKVMARSFHIMRADFDSTSVKAFQKCMFEGQTPKEVAAELSISINAVYLAKSHILRRLRQEFAGLLD